MGEKYIYHISNIFHPNNMKFNVVNFTVIHLLCTVRKSVYAVSFDYFE